MAKLWCECNKCHGGKVVARATWYRHQKKVDTSNVPARRNLSAGLAPLRSMDIDVNGTEEGDPPDVANHSPGSDVVSALS